MVGLPLGLPRSHPGKRRPHQRTERKPEPWPLVSRPVSPSATARCGWTPAPQPSAASWRLPWAGPRLSAVSPDPVPMRWAGAGARRKVKVKALVPFLWVSGRTRLVAGPCGYHTRLWGHREARTRHSGPGFRSRPTCLLVLPFEQGQASSVCSQA